MKENKFADLSMEVAFRVYSAESKNNAIAVLLQWRTFDAKEPI